MFLKTRFLIALFTCFFSVSLMAKLTVPTISKPSGSLKDAPVSLYMAWTGNSVNVQFELDTNEFFNSPLLFKTVAYREVKVRQLRFNTRYYWRIRAYSGTDSSNWTAKRYFTTVGAPIHYEPKANDTAATIVARLGTYLSGAFVRIQMDTTDKFDSPELFSQVYNDTFPKQTYPSVTTMFENNRLMFDTKYYIRMKYFHDKDSSGYSYNTIKTLKGPQVGSPKGGASTLVSISPYVSVLKSIIPGLVKPADSVYYQFQLDTTNTFGNPKSYYSANTAINQGAVVLDYFGRMYYIRVRAFNPIDTSVWSKIESFKTADQPDFFSPGPSVSQIRADSQVFSTSFAAWNHELQLDTSSSFNSPAFKQVYGINAAFTVKGLLFNQKYYARLRGNNPLDTSLWAYRAFYTTYKQQLLSPANTSTYLLTALKLQWEKMAGAVSYEWMVDTSKTFNSPELVHRHVKGAFNADSVKELNFDARYYWRVRAAFSYDTADWTNVFSFTTSPMAIYINSPYNGQTDVGVDPTPFDWNDVNYSYIKGYHYQVSKDTFFANPINGYTTYANSYKDLNGLEYKTRYFFRVRCFHAKDTNDWYYEHYFTTKAPDPAPVAPVKTAPANNSIYQNYQTLTLSWKAVANATSYDVESDVSPTFSAPLKGNFTATSINMTNLQPGTKYYWRVKALNNKTEGPWSAVWNFTTLPLLRIPANLSPNNFEEKPKAFSLKWDEVQSAEQYQYQLANSPFFGTQVFVTTTNAAPLKGLTDGLTYYWQVRAVIGPYASAWSDIAIFRVNGSLTGIEENLTHNSLKLYPNPGNGLFFIEGNTEGITSFDVYDAMGKHLGSIPLSSADLTGKPSIDLTYLPPGVYMLQTTVNGKVLTYKVSTL
jgi:hypothetical protein